MPNDNNTYKEQLIAECKHLESTLGAKHPRTAMQYARIADFLSKEDNLELAAEYLKKALLQEQGNLPAEEFNSRINAVRGQLGVLYYNLEEYAKAIPLLEQSVNFAAQAFGEGSPYRLVPLTFLSHSLEHLADRAFDKENFKETAEYLEKIVGYFAEVYGTDSDKYGIACEKLGFTYDYLGYPAEKSTKWLKITHQISLNSKGQLENEAETIQYHINQIEERWKKKQKS